MSWELLIALGLGVLVAVLNSLAGGGSSFSLPGFIFMGLPAGVANGTNRFGLIWGNIMSFYGLYRKGKFNIKVFKPLVIPILLGAALGAYAAVFIPDSLFEGFLALVLLTVAGMNIWHLLQAQSPSQEAQVQSMSKWGFLVFMGVGFYGGFIQVGVGFVMIYAFSKWSKLSLIEVNAMKSGVAALFMIQSFMIFLWHGKIDWPIGLAYALGCLLGGYLGAHIQVRKGEKFLKWVMVLASVAIAIQLLIRFLSNF